MEWIDKDREQAVWHRVRPAAEEPRRLELRALELAAAENTATYRRLWSGSGGRARQTLALLLAGSRREGAILRGLQRLAGGGQGEKTPPVPRQTAPEALGQCYHRTRRSLEEYTARTLDPELGCVFQELSRMTQRQCTAIAQCVGELTVDS